MTTIEYRLHLIPTAGRTTTTPFPTRTGRSTTPAPRPRLPLLDGLAEPTGSAVPVGTTQSAIPSCRVRSAICASPADPAGTATPTGASNIPATAHAPSQAERQLAALIGARPETSAPWQTRRSSHATRLHPFLYPHGDLAERARAYRRKREAAQAIPSIHLPVWRWRVAVLAAFLPILSPLPRCRAAGCNHWPCKPLLEYLHKVHGWGPKADEILTSLATKRRRAKAARRSPTAVSHRAGRTRFTTKTKAATR